MIRAWRRWMYVRRGNEVVVAAHSAILSSFQAELALRTSTKYHADTRNAFPNRELSPELMSLSAFVAMRKPSELLRLSEKRTTVFLGQIKLRARLHHAVLSEP
jgi:hypothetical protein